IREVALQCGFNLSAADLNGAKEQYNNLAKSEVAKAILRKLDDTWENQLSGHLADVCQGVYIISLSGNICFDYKNGQSQIIYIGKGWIRSRIVDHLKNWIAHISESLQDMKIDISMAEIKIRNATKASEEVESDLLEKF